MSSNQTNSCPVCDSTAYRILPYGGYYYKDRNMPLVECQNCFLKYIIHGLTSQEFTDFYNDPKYFDSEYAGGVEVNYSDNKTEIEEKSIHILDIIQKYKPKGKFLEIGCAGGYLLETAKDKFNYIVKGIEVSERMSAEGRSRGLDIFCGSIEQAPENWESFDIVYMGDVLEHISEPKKFMQSVKNRMAPKALLALELPLTYNFTLSGILIGLLNILKGNFGRVYFLPAHHRNNFADKPPYHVLMFSRRSVKSFFEREGFVIKYLKIYEGKPKPKFKGTWYGRLKLFTHWLTLRLTQSSLGDRMIVLAEKI